MIKQVFELSLNHLQIEAQKILEVDTARLYAAARDRCL